MEYVVYVLKSTSSDKHYIGFTQNLISRFRSHNELGKKGFTTRYRPWFVIWVEFYSVKAEALSREKFLKTGKGREWLHNSVKGY